MQKNSSSQTLVSKTSESNVWRNIKFQPRLTSVCTFSKYLFFSPSICEHTVHLVIKMFHYFHTTSKQKSFNIYALKPNEIDVVYQLSIKKVFMYIDQYWLVFILLKFIHNQNNVLHNFYNWVILYCFLAELASRLVKVLENYLIISYVKH